MTSPSDADRHLINRFFAAMQSGAVAETEMMSLFAPDAEYIEPFSGAPRTHRGKDAIRDVMREGWKTPLPDMRIEIDKLTIAQDVMSAEWTCYSPALPGGQGRGENRFTLKGGKIVRLETRFLGG